MNGETELSEYDMTGGFIDISPSEPLHLAGYEARNKLSAGVADPIEANALILETDAERMVFIGLDVLYVGGELRGAIEAGLADILRPCSLFIAASHTHFAPATDSSLPLLGKTSLSYVASVAERVVQLIRNLVSQKRRRVRLNYSRGETDHAVYRRRAVTRPRLSWPPWGNRWEMRPDFEAQINRTVHVLSLADRDRKLAAVCWSYACHPVCFPDRELVSSDFPGVVRASIRRLSGPIPVLFWQGFSGDIRPRAVRIVPLLGFIPLTPSFTRFTHYQWQQWSQSLATRVNEILDGPHRRISGPVQPMRWSVPLAAFGPSAPERVVTIQKIDIGSDLRVLGVSMEPLNAYSERLARLHAARTVIPVGCIDHVSGYLPTGDVVEQGGYESVGSIRLFGLRGSYRKDISVAVEELILSRP